MTLSSEEKCEAVVEEVKEILDSYDVFEHDTEKIIGEIENVYGLLGQSYTLGRQLEAYIRDELGDEGYSRFIKIITGREKPTGKYLKAEC